MASRLLEEPAGFVRFGESPPIALLRTTKREWGRMIDEPDKVNLETPDLAVQYREALDELFPGVVSDGVLDTAKLAELLGGIAVAMAPDGRERYGLQWAGK